MSEVGSLVIRPTSVDDVPVILEMIHGLAVYEKMTDEVVATPELLEATLFSERPDAHCVLAEMGGDVVGIAIYFFNYSTFLAQKGLHLEDLFVKESARGRGYGEKILRYLAGLLSRRSVGVLNGLSWTGISLRLVSTRRWERKCLPAGVFVA